MKIAPVAAIAALGLATAAPARAARPMVTDDARIVDAKACQVEAWARSNRDSTEYWALPACNPTGDFELTFGGGRTQGTGSPGLTDIVLQAKAILRPLEPGGVGVGLAAGTVRKPRRETHDGWPGDPYFYVPVSVSFPGDRWVMHLNAGATRDRGQGRNVFTWGFGHEIALRDDLFLVPELFHNDAGRPFYQVGLRQWLTRDRLQVDATLGNRAGAATQERWFSVGVRILTPAFLP